MAGACVTKVVSELNQTVNQRYNNGLTNYNNDNDYYNWYQYNPHLKQREGTHKQHKTSVCATKTGTIST